MPIGIIGTLLTATLLYMSVSFFDWHGHLDVANSVAFALQSVCQVNIGTFLAFTMVSFGIIPLRKRDDILNEGGFKVPLYPVLPLLSGFACLFMMSFLSKETWIGAGIWFAIGMVLYFGYGYRHSNINDSVIPQA